MASSNDWILLAAVGAGAYLIYKSNILQNTGEVIEGIGSGGIIASQGVGSAAADAASVAADAYQDVLSPTDIISGWTDVVTSWLDKLKAPADQSLDKKLRSDNTISKKVSKEVIQKSTSALQSAIRKAAPSYRINQDDALSMSSYSLGLNMRSEGKPLTLRSKTETKKFDLSRSPTAKKVSGAVSSIYKFSTIGQVQSGYKKYVAPTAKKLITKIKGWFS